MKYVAVLPFAHRPYYDECRATLKLDYYPIDNTVENRGVAESWNLGIDRMREVDAEWLIIISTSMRFGKPGGLDILPLLEKAPHASVIFPSDKDYGPLGFRGFGYHCAALHRDVIDRVGYFDTNFYPIYFEDADYNLRCEKALIGWQSVPSIDAQTIGYSKTVEAAEIISPSEPSIAYFATKWGIHPDAANTLGSYDYPFNNPDYSIQFFPPAHGRTWDQ